MNEDQPEPWNELKRAFVHDHRVLTRGFRDLIAQLDAADYFVVAKLADQLDQLAGPHIEFEERYLYPAGGRIRGQDYAENLYDEHAEVIAAITELQELTDASEPSEQQLADWRSSLQHGLEHAAACGSLLSHLQVMPSEQQKEYLDAMQELRVQARRWSEFHGEKTSQAD